MKKVKDYKEDWLPSYENIVSKLGNRGSITMYSIALEGWRRGLELKFHRIFTKDKKLIIQYTLANKDRKHIFQLSFGDQVSKDASSIAKDKNLAKEYLQKSHVNVPLGKRFTYKDSNEEIINASRGLGFPLVVKPTKGSLGKGVVINILNGKELLNALSYVRETLNMSDVIVEEYILGEEFRVYVIKNKVAGVYKRIPANVVGNGKETIKDLIQRKNEIRKKNPHLSKHPIKINTELEKILHSSGLDLDIIPKRGERVFVGVKNDLPLGGDSIDVTDEFLQRDKNVAIKAAQALPGMPHCGVDILVDSNRGAGYVLEVNPRPNIGGHLFPMEGMARDIPKAIIDYYFSETITENINNRNHKYYFNLKDIVKTIKEGIVSEVTVPSIPKGNIVKNRIIVSGDVSGVGYKQWIKRKALGMRVDGYVNSLKNGNVLIIASGRVKNIQLFIDTLKESSPPKVNVKDVKVQNSKKAVTIGFNVI